MVESIGQTLFYHFCEMKKIRCKFCKFDLISEFIDRNFTYVLKVPNQMVFVYILIFKILFEIQAEYLAVASHICFC